MTNGLHEDDLRKAVTWAHLTLRSWGWSTYKDEGYEWVVTPDGEVGCSSNYDLVSFISDANKLRAGGRS